MNLMIDNIGVTFFASLFIYFIFIGLIILWFIDGKIKREQVVHALMSCFFAYIIALIIKQIYPTIRPFMVNGGEVGVIIPPMGGAFPSEHTVIAFALSVTVFLHDRKVGLWFLFSALIIGIARVIANVHYPIDIVGGAFLGTITAVVVDNSHYMNIVNTLTPRRKISKNRRK